MNNILIVLIDFKGHPVLGCEYINNLRYSNLLNIIKEFNRDSNIDNVMVLSNDTSCLKMQEIRKITSVPWHTTNDNGIAAYRLPKILLDKFGFILSPEHTTVVIGGTNTSGCVLHNKNISAAEFAKIGFNPKIYLPLCADYEVSGINDIEKNMNAFGGIYEYIKRHNLINKIDVINRYQQIINE